MTDQKGNSKLPPLELLLDYLDGIIDPVSGRKIEEQIKSSERLASTIEGIRYYYEQNGYDRLKVEAYIRKVGTGWDSHEPSTKLVIEKGNFSFLRIAASISIIIAVGSLIFLSSLESADEFVAAELNTIYPLPDVSRGSLPGDGELWRDAFSAYSNRSFDEAQLSFSEIDQSESGNVTASFYLGLSHLYQNPPQPDEALPFLEVVLRSSHRLKDRARWFQALALYLSGNIDLSKEVLAGIVTDKGYKWEESAELLGKLE